MSSIFYGRRELYNRSLVPERIHRVGQGRPDGLEANREKGDEKDQAGRKRKNPAQQKSKLLSIAQPPRRAYYIFSPEGRYTCRLWLDFRPGVFVRGKMYRLHSDEDTGFVRAKRYSVTWSER